MITSSQKNYSIYENAAECPVLWTGMNAVVLRFDRQDILVLHCIFAEAGKPRLSVKPRPEGAELHSTPSSWAFLFLPKKTKTQPEVSWVLLSYMKAGLAILSSRRPYLVSRFSFRRPRLRSGYRCIRNPRTSCCTSFLAEHQRARIYPLSRIPGTEI